MIFRPQCLEELSHHGGILLNIFLVVQKHGRVIMASFIHITCNHSVLLHYHLILLPLAVDVFLIDRQSRRDACLQFNQTSGFKNVCTT